MKRLARAAAALGLAALSGCVAVPTSGPVVVSSQRAHTAEPQIDVRPRPPAADADALSVASGFLVAMGDSRGDFTVARQYLTETAARAWRPEHGVQVYASSAAPRESAQGVVSLEATTLGTVDQRGSYVGHRQQVRHDFELIKVNGQWRINNPPDGLLISSALFANNYASATLYFFDPSFSTTVPDVIYVPRETVSAAQIVRGVLAGPTDWLAPAVRSAVPSGLGLGNGGVSVSPHGVVTVSLNDAAGSLGSDEARTRLAAQLTLSLRRNLPATTGLTLLDESAPIALPDAAGGVWPSERADPWSPLGLRPIPDLFGVRDDRVVRIADASNEAHVEPLSGSLGRSGLGIDAVAVALDGSQAAAVAQHHSVLLAGGLGDAAPPTEVWRAPGLLRPQYSRFGELWAMATDQGTTQVRRARAGTGAATPVSAPALSGIAVDQFRLSPDGTRMIVLGRRDAQPVLGLVQVRRGPDGISLDGWRALDVGNDATGPTVAAAAWRSDTQLLLLGSDRETGSLNPYDLDVDGRGLARGASAIDGSALTTLPFSRFAAAVLTADGHVVRRTDAAHWPELDSKVTLTDLTYPG